MSNTPIVRETKYCSHKTSVTLGFIVIVIVTFFCFAPSLRNELLIWDDFGYITENEHIHSLTFDTVVWAFSEFYANSWFPLTWLSLALDYYFWGNNPVGYHLTNNIIHALNAGLFFMLSLKLLEEHQDENNDDDKQLLLRKGLISSALLASCIFALHPLRVESVAWAAERKDVLSTFFGLSALIAYLRHVKSTETDAGHSSLRFHFLVSPYYWLMMAAFCLSLLCKPMFVTLPLILIILDRFPLYRFSTTKAQNLLIEKAPLVVFSGMASVITSLSQSVIITSHDSITMYSRVLNAFNTIMLYLWLTIWPVKINPLYIHPGNINGLSMEHVWPILFFIVISLCCLILWKRAPIFMAVWLLYLITLLPVIGLVQVGPQAMAARYTYLPGLPISLLLAVGARTLYGTVYRINTARIVLLVASCLLALSGIYTTISHIGYWKDDISLWTRAIELQTRPTGRAYFQRSAGYMLKGDYAKALVDLNEAVAIAYSKGYREMHTIYLARARALKHLGDLEGAVADYTRCLETDNSPARQMYYQERGIIYQELGRNDLADEDFRKAVTLLRQVAPDQKKKEFL